MIESQIYGYARCSTKEQNEDRQVIAMLEFGITPANIVVEKLSGKDFNRPQYRALLKQLKPGDTFVIKSIDRLGRDYEEIIEQWRCITKDKKAFVVVIDMPLLDTRIKDRDLTGTFVSDLVLQILSYVAQTERAFMHRRQAEGIAAAKLKGIKFGRPRKKAPANFGAVVEQWEQREITFKEVLKQSGLTKSTFYRRLSDYKDSLKTLAF